MAIANVSRRGFMGHLAGSYTAVAMGSGAMVAGYDPLMAFLTKWDRVIAEYEAGRRGTEGDDVFWQAHVAPMEDQCSSGCLPDATTAEGAAAAIRKALSYGDMERQDANLVRSALAFLEAQA